VAALIAQGVDVNGLCVEDSARLQFNALVNPSLLFYYSQA